MNVRKEPKMMKSYVCMIVLACGLIVVGCGARNGEQGAPGDVAVAKVNGVEITRVQVEGAVRALTDRFGGQVPAEQLAAMKPILWKQALESLINQQLLIQEAEREGIQPDEKKIDAQMEEIAGRVPEGKSIEELLASMGITESQLRRNIGQDLKIGALLDKEIPQGEEPSNKEIKAFYREHPEQFKTPERVKASHILVKVDPGESAEAKAQKKLKIEALRDRIKKGEDFAELARENSDGPSKSQGGDLGYFARGRMIKPFEDVAFGMKVGRVSDVVETQFGYHLIKLTGREEEEVTPLKKARDKVVELINRQKRQGAVGEYLQKLRDTAKIEYTAEPPPGAR
jgi:peptidyl-prolyl cis-trans isomerase C